MAAGSVPVGESASAFDNGRPLNCETHQRPRQSQLRGICTNTWVVDVGRGLLAAKAELRYWAMPLGGSAKGDSPAAIAQADQAEWAAEHGASETAARLSISSPRTGTPTRRFGLWQNMRPYSAKCLISGGQRRPTVPRAACYETTTARETLGGHTPERPMRVEHVFAAQKDRMGLFM